MLQRVATIPYELDTTAKGKTVPVLN